jgi:hypothetical protein
VSHHIKVNLVASHFGQIQVGIKNTFLKIYRPGQHIAQRQDDGAATSTHNLWLIIQILDAAQIQT